MNKFIYLIPALFVMLLLTACINDDDTTSTNELEGTWKLVTLDIDVESITEANGQSFTTISDMVAENADYTVTFDGDQFTAEGRYDLRQTSTFDGYSQTITTPYENVLVTGDYTLDDNAITTDQSFVQATANGTNVIETGGESQTTEYTINANGQLVMSQNEEFVLTTSAGPITSTNTNTIVSSMVWEKE